MVEEYYIYDIGRDGYSPFYNDIELPAVQNYGRVYKTSYIKVMIIREINIHIVYPRLLWH